MTNNPVVIVGGEPAAIMDRVLGRDVDPAIFSASSSAANRQPVAALVTSSAQSRAFK